MRVCDRRQRGGQPGNLNALKHGGTCAAARALAREISLLLADARFALLASEMFTETGIDFRKDRKRMAAIDLSEQALIRNGMGSRCVMSHAKTGKTGPPESGGHGLPDTADAAKYRPSKPIAGEARAP